MRKSLLVMFVIMAILLAGCGGNEVEKTPDKADATPSAIVNNEESDTPQKEVEEVVEEVAKELTEGEKLVIDYINIFLNGSDLEAKGKFLDDNIHPDVKSMFSLVVKRETPDENKLLSPEVVDSVDYEEAGKKGTMTLIKGTKNGKESEMIFIVMDGKIGWGFSDSEKTEQLQKAFTTARSKF